MTSSSLTDTELTKIENECRVALERNKGIKQPVLILAKAKDLLTLIDEVRDLRRIVSEQALTAAYMAGEANRKEAEKWNGILPQTMIPNQSIPVISK